MMVENQKKVIVWAVILSESMHVFCCVLPTIFTVMSLLAGAGMISTMPGFIEDLHHMIHDYEVPMIIASGVVLAIGWGLNWYSQKMNCESNGCCPEPCAPKKGSLHLLLIVATLLFVVNVTVYMVFHRVIDQTVIEEVHDGHDHHDHHGHDH